MVGLALGAWRGDVQELSPLPGHWCLSFGGGYCHRAETSGWPWHPPHHVGQAEVRAGGAGEGSPHSPRPASASAHILARCRSRVGGLAGYSDRTQEQFLYFK